MEGKSRMVHAGDYHLTNSMSFGRPYILQVDGCIHDGWLVISQSSECWVGVNKTVYVSLTTPRRAEAYRSQAGRNASSL